MLDDNDMVATIFSPEIHDGVILFDTDRRHYYNLDALDALVWRLVQRPMSLVEIRDAVVETFDLEPETAEHDLIHLLEEMETAGLIEAAS